ncbi:MAG: hypothetical protein JNL79_30425 [Myxococcales bacterium]|nr:hypothetical protein [Myxococcales bacterium]
MRHLAFVVSLAALYGCSSPERVTETPDSTGDAVSETLPDTSVPEVDGSADAPTDAKPCEGGLECLRPTCSAGATTSLSGIVYMPNGKVPLYNAMVFIPNAPLPAMPVGATCDRCGVPPGGSPLAIDLTKTDGKFTLNNVPAGAKIPLVVQIGKWRRKTEVEIKPCEANVLTDPELTRLPRNRKEGNLPKIAVTTGGCDKLACILPKIGIDATEYGVDGADAAVHFYAGSGGTGGPAGMKPAKTLWDSTPKLMDYDLALFSCECSEAPDSKSATSYAAVSAYLGAGGRIFTTDFQYNWYKQSPDPKMQAMATIPGGAPTAENPVTLQLDFAKGKALASWMVAVDKTYPFAKVTCDYVFGNITDVPDKSVAQVYATSGSTPPSGLSYPRFVSVNAPAGRPVGSQCGKAVHLDAHINQKDTLDASFPKGCTSPLTAGEQAFAFFLFDVGACLQDDTKDPVVPPLK